MSEQRMVSACLSEWAKSDDEVVGEEVNVAAVAGRAGQVRERVMGGCMSQQRLREWVCNKQNGARVSEG